MIICKDSHYAIAPLKATNVNDLINIRNQKFVRQNLTNTMIINEMEQQKWFETTFNDETKKYFVIVDLNDMDYAEHPKVIGSVWFDEYDKVNSSCRPGIILSEDYTGKGIGSLVFDTFISYLFKDLHLHRLWLLVLEYNKGAISLYLKLGFKKEGVQRKAIWRKGSYWDYIMMSVLDKEYGV